MSAAEPSGEAQAEGSAPAPSNAPEEKAQDIARISQGQERDRLSKTLRHQRILAQLEAAPTLRASELALALSVSGETIRRDLMELQKQGYAYIRP